MDSWIDERFLEVSPITLPFPERGGDSERAAFPGTNTPIIMKAPLLSFRVALLKKLASKNWIQLE